MRKHLNEAEWAASNDSLAMLRARRGHANAHPRKVRLFGVAGCERIEHLLVDQRSLAAVDTAGRYAEGLIGEGQRLAAAEAADAAFRDAFPKKGKRGASAEWAAEFVLGHQPFLAAQRACNFAFVAAGDRLDSGPEHAAQAHLLRDIFGNPFRPATINPAWVIVGVLELAQAIYEERAFDRLPELADALVAAGCDDQEVPNHCRSDGPHVRGCWVVDLVLGKD